MGPTVSKEYSVLITMFDNMQIFSSRTQTFMILLKYHLINPDLEVFCLGINI